MPKVDIPDIAFEKLKTWKEAENFTWKYIFENMSLNLMAIEPYLKTIDEGVAINTNTLFTFYDIWIDNFSDNFKYFKDSKPFESLVVKKKPALILGAGPSLKGNWDLIKQFEGDIFCCDILIKECLNNGVVPTHVTAIDGLEKVADYFDSPIVRKHIGDINAILVSTVHSKVTKRVKNRYFVHPQLDNPMRANPPSVTRFMVALNEAHKTSIPVMSVLGNVGMASWMFANLLGYDPIVLLGIDLGFKTENGKVNLDDSPTFAGFKKSLKRGEMTEAEILACFDEKVNKFGNLVFTDVIKRIYFNTAEKHLKTKGQTETIQCGEFCYLDECRCMKFEDYINEQ